MPLIRPIYWAVQDTGTTPETLSVPASLALLGVQAMPWLSDSAMKTPGNGVHPPLASTTTEDAVTLSTVGSVGSTFLNSYDQITYIDMEGLGYDLDTDGGPEEDYFNGLGTALAAIGTPWVAHSQMRDNLTTVADRVKWATNNYITQSVGIVQPMYAGNSTQSAATLYGLDNRGLWSVAVANGAGIPYFGGVSAEYTGGSTKVSEEIFLAQIEAIGTALDNSNLVGGIVLWGTTSADAEFYEQMVMANLDTLYTGALPLNESPQNNHGSMVFTEDVSSYLQSETAATGSGSSYAITSDSDFYLKKQAAFGCWLKITDGALSTDKRNIMGLTRLTGSAAPSMLGLYYTGTSGNVNGYLKNTTTGTTAITSFFAPPVDEEIFIVFVADSDGLSDGVWGTSSDSIAIFSYQAGGSITLERSSAPTGFSSGELIGCADNAGTNAYKWQISNSDNTDSIGFSVRDVFAFDDISALTPAILQDIAESKKAPTSVAGCLRWWSLDGAGESLVAESSTVQVGDLELKDIAGDLAGSPLHLTTIGGTAPTYSASTLGPVVLAATDPIINHDFPSAPLAGNLTNLGAAWNGGDCDLHVLGDSFATGGSNTYSTIAAILGVGTAGVDIVGVTQGCPSSSNITGSTGYARAVSNRTLYTAGVVKPSTGDVYGWCQGAGTGATFNRTLLRDGSAIERALFLDAGGLEFYNNSGGVHSDTLGIITARADWEQSSGGGTQYDWLTTGDKLACRVMGYDYLGSNYTIQQASQTALNTAGNVALPRWSLGGDPYNDGAEALTGARAGEEFFWFYNDPSAPVTYTSPTNPTFQFDTASLPDGEWAHMLAASVHKVDASGYPMPGLHIITSAVGSAGDSGFYNNAVGSGSGLKQYKQDNLLEFVDGAKWRSGGTAVVLYDIADSETVAEADMDALLDDHRATYLAAGYTKVHFVLVSNFLHNVGTDTSIYDHRTDAIAREDTYLTQVAKRTDTTILSTFMMHGGALPGGYSYDSGAFEPLSTSGALFGGYPLREQRTAKAAIEALGITLGANSGAMLDDSNLHRDPTGSGQDDSEAVNVYWLNLIMALPSGGGNRGATAGKLIAMGII